MRLIDAYTLKESLKQLKNDAYMEDEVIEAAVYDLCIDRVETSPAIEAEPMKHGEWKHILGMNSKCSECGRYFPVKEFESRPFDINYCPNCGARMDGSVE